MNNTRAWQLRGGRTLALDRPRIMGILNVTPDSFSDGGEIASVQDAVIAARRMVQAGADILDVGGESTRPGASRVPASEQIHRVASVIRAVHHDMGNGTPISIDTTLTEVAIAAIDAGADAINDVSAGTEDPEMFALAARSGAGLILMHRLAPPGADVYSHQYANDPTYPGGVVACVKAFLAERARLAILAGVPREAIVLDPGLGFGKSVTQNLELIERTRELADPGFPILSGLSRKSFTAIVAGLPKETPPRERVQATINLSLAHLRAGASIFRVHDVAEHALALAGADHRTPTNLKPDPA